MTEEIIKKIWDSNYPGEYNEITEENINEYFLDQLHIKIQDIVKRNNYTIILNDENHPYHFSNSFDYFFYSTIFLNPQLYKQNPDLFTDIIVKAITYSHHPTLNLSEDIILNSKILDAIVKNTYIEELDLNNRPLSMDLYDSLKRNPNIKINTTNIPSDMQDIFDDQIPFNKTRPLVINYNFNQLQKIKEITLTRDLTALETEYLIKYAPNLKKIILSNEALLNIPTILEKFKNFNFNICLKLIKNKEYNLEELKKIVNEYPNITVQYEYNEYPLQDYINMEDGLNKLLLPIKDLKLTPLEKFIYVFNVTKRFRKYKKSENNPSISRSLIELFKEGNEYIVCLGYSNILEALCKRLNIPIVGLSADIAKINDLNEINYVGHARNLVYLKDEEYHIDGTYISDATWSNRFDYDLLTTALLTPYETINMENEIKDGETPLLSAQSYEEFIYLIYKELKSDNINILEINFGKLISNIKILFPDFNQILLNFKSYNEFNSKISSSLKDYYQLFIDEDFMKTLYNFIKNKTNNIIPGETLINASVNLQRKLNPEMTEEELINYRNKLIADNYFGYNKLFPPIVKTGINDEKEIIANEINKFGQGPRKI